LQLDVAQFGNISGAKVVFLWHRQGALIAGLIFTPFSATLLP
jgi:hypothetical protein